MFFFSSIFFRVLFRIQAPTMMLLMGMWINLTKNPMNPIKANPIAVAMAIFWNSFLSGLVHLLTNLTESLLNCLTGSRWATIWSMLRLLRVVWSVRGYKC